jgi:hypothetical protein
MRREFKIAVHVAVGFAGGITGVVIASAAEAGMPPALTGLLAALFSASLGTVSLLGTLRLIED